MNADTLLENLEILAEAPGGIDRLRQLVLDLAVCGQLVEHESDHRAAEQFIERFGSKLTEGSAPAESAPFKVPTNWRWAHFSDVSINRDRERIPLSQSEREGRQGKYDYYGASGVIDTINDYIFDKTLLLIGEDGANLVNRSTPIAFMASGKFWVNNHAHVIDSLDLDALRYLAIVINQMDLKPFLTGTAQPKLNQAKLSKILVPVPPHSEQKRIVARVDELMALCDQLEQQQQQRDNLRTATRKSAIDAISTATTPAELKAAWKRINDNWSTFSDALEDITSLRRLILDLLMSGNLPAKNSQKSNWVTKKFDDLGQCRLGKMLDKAKNTGELRPYLRNTNVQWFRIDKSDVANMRVSQNEADEFTLKAGDLLICEGGQPGRCSIVGAAEENLLFQKALHRFRPNDSTDVKFVAYSLLRAAMNGTLEKLFTGVTIKHLTGQSLKGLEIAIPSLGEQGRVVAEVDEFMALCDQLESELKSRSEVADKFARSCLQQYLGN